MRTITNAQCNSSPWMPVNEVLSDQMCAVGTGRGTCENDFGGPLITNEGKYYSIIGKNKPYDEVLGAAQLIKRINAYQHISMHINSYTVVYSGTQ